MPGREACALVPGHMSWLPQRAAVIAHYRQQTMRILSLAHPPGSFVPSRRSFGSKFRSFVDHLSTPARSLRTFVREKHRSQLQSSPVLWSGCYAVLGTDT